MPDPVPEPGVEDGAELLVREIDIPLGSEGVAGVVELVEVTSREDGTGIGDVNDGIADSKEPDI